MDIKLDTLAAQLNQGLLERRLSVEELADRTKVPASTIRSFLNEPVTGVLPERVYLRGHLAVLARELRLDVAALQSRFDIESPELPTTKIVAPPPRFQGAGVAVVAGLAGIAILAVVLSFVSSLR